MTKPASPQWKDEWRLLSPLLDQALALEGEERQSMDQGPGARDRLPAGNTASRTQRPRF